MFSKQEESPFVTLCLYIFSGYIFSFYSLMVFSYQFVTATLHCSLTLSFHCHCLLQLLKPSVNQLSLLPHMTLFVFFYCIFAMQQFSLLMSLTQLQPFHFHPLLHQQPNLLYFLPLSSLLLSILPSCVQFALQR